MKKQISKIIVAFVMCVTFLFASIETVTVDAKYNYKKIYSSVVASPKSVYKYAKFLKKYPYNLYKPKYTKHFYYDLDKNGVKELFVYDPSGSKNDDSHFVLVFTIKNGKVKLLGSSGSFCGINKKKKVLIEHGHWHGAGGSDEYEWSVYKINKKKTGLTWKYYFDKDYDGKYKVYYPKTGKTKKSKKLYKKMYRKYVKNTKYVFYK